MKYNLKSQEVLQLQNCRTLNLWNVRPRKDLGDHCLLVQALHFTDEKTEAHGYELTNQDQQRYLDNSSALQILSRCRQITQTPDTAQNTEVWSRSLPSMCLVICFTYYEAEQYKTTDLLGQKPSDIGTFI